MVNFGPPDTQKIPPNLKNGPRGAKFPFSECQNYTDKSISQIPPGPPNRGSKPPGGGGHPHPPPPPPPARKTVAFGGVLPGVVASSVWGSEREVDTCGGRGGVGGPGMLV